MTKYELLKHLRRRRLYATLVITILVVVIQLAVPLTFNIAFPKEARDAASSFFSFVNFLIIIVGAFFAGDAIASEFEHKTGYIVFPNPISRVTLVLGKFAAAFVSALLTVGFFYMVGIGALWGIYGIVPLETITSFAYAVLYVCCVLGLTFLFSTTIKGSMGATLLAFFTLFLILPMASSILTLTGNEPWYIPTYASGIVTQIFNPQEDTVMEIPGSPLKIYIFYPKFLISVIVMAVYFVVALVFSLVIAKKREMA